jgi:pimeloyl-ACP methyl ester carboxylesterase
MASFRVRIVLVGLGAVVLAAVAVVASQLPSLGAGALLHPLRRHVDALPPEGCSETAFSGAGINLAGWKCRGAGERRGTLIYLHGVGDNRVSSVATIQRFRPLGFDVIAYDGRAHGDSGGDICTYGFFEKQDLRHVIDSVKVGPIVLIGGSLGAAVAIQSAAEDSRVSAVVAAETFSDLRTVATERAPFFFTRGTIAQAFRLAEQQGRFDVDAVSPMAAATKIAVPVLLIHGDADRETPPDHSRRVFAALHGPKRLMMVPGAQHNGSLRPEIWDHIERWVRDTLEHTSG